MNLKLKIREFINEDTNVDFEQLAIEVFNYQATENKIYNKFLQLLSLDPSTVKRIEQIPFFPIRLFKEYEVQTGDWNAEATFYSSGTTLGRKRSKHLVKDLSFYEQISSTLFKEFYPDNNYEILALLPSYLENGDSSLVAMVKHLMDIYNNKSDAFYLYDFKALNDRIQEILKNSSKQIILFGVSFALLDFCQEYAIADERLRIVFTGGMKSRGEELSYKEMYSILKRSFVLSSIDSEYGMTEMFSQSYCLNHELGHYKCGKTIKVFSQELQDPLSHSRIGKTGQLAFIDLANIDTLSFVLTDDLIVLNKDQSFSVLGRISESDIRGCNLLYQS